MHELLNKDDFSLGEGLGYVTGMIIFEVVLAIVTGGAWAAVRTASVPLNALLRVIRAGDQITRAMLGTVVAMGRPIMKGFGAAAGLLGRIPGVSSIVRRAREGLRRLFRSADEAASGGGLHGRSHRPKLGRLSKKGDTWISDGGLAYGPDRRFGNRIRHVLAHTKPDPTKLKHNVFSDSPSQILELLDHAWLRRGNALPNDPAAFVVDMGRVVGTMGEKHIRLIVKPNTNRLITAYPVP